MKGFSSLGLLRFAVLLGVGKGGYKDGGLCLIDIKEGSKAAAPRAAHTSMPKSNAKRVVEGACKLSPFLGERMLAVRLLDRDVFMRELMPQDLKLKLDQLTCQEATAGARFLATVVRRHTAGKWMWRHKKNGNLN
jgi:uncharacterized protein (DUF2252 family)